jgi:hypothetical protein
MTDDIEAKMAEQAAKIAKGEKRGPGRPRKFRPEEVVGGIAAEVTPDVLEAKAPEPAPEKPMIHWPLTWKKLGMCGSFDPQDGMVEPMLRRASIAFALQNGGGIAREFAHHLLRDNIDPERNKVTIDVFCHEIPAGCRAVVSKLVGWRREGFESRGALLKPPAETPRQYRMLCVGEVGMIGIVLRPFETPEGSGNGPWPTIQPDPVMDGHVYTYTSNDWICDMRAPRAGWRVLVRATMDDPFPPANRVAHCVTVERLMNREGSQILED